MFDWLIICIMIVGQLSIQADLSPLGIKDLQGEGIRCESVYEDKVYHIKMESMERRVGLDFEITLNQGGLETTLFDTRLLEEREFLEDLTFLDVFNVYDLNTDGSEELYLSFEDSLGEEVVFVFANPYVMGILGPDDGEGKLFLAFKGYSSGYFEYIDLDGDGALEIISQHPVRVGDTSTWRGLDLLSEWNGQKYEFSYDLTRRYALDQMIQADTEFEMDRSPEKLEGVLFESAQLGLFKTLEYRIQRALDEDEFYFLNQERHGQLYNDYLIAMALVYDEEWKTLADQTGTIYHSEGNGAVVADEQITLDDVEGLLNLSNYEVFELLGWDYELANTGVEGIYQGYWYKDIGLTVTFDEESDQILFIYFDQHVDLHGAHAGMNFDQVMTCLGNTPVVKTWIETPDNVAYEIVYTYDTYILVFLACDPSGLDSFVTLYQNP